MYLPVTTLNAPTNKDGVHGKMAKDKRNQPAAPIGCSIHHTLQTAMPCVLCKRQRELFPRSEVYRAVPGGRS